MPRTTARSAVAHVSEQGLELSPFPTTCTLNICMRSYAYSSLFMPQVHSIRIGSMYTPTPRCTHGRWASYEETGLDSDRLVLMWDAETAPPVGGARYPGRSFPICKVEYTPRAPSPPTAPPSPPATVATMASVLTTCSYPLATIETHEGCEAAIRELFPTEFLQRGLFPLF